MSDHSSGHGHRHGHDHPRDRHGNPEDLERYLARLEDPERIAWQKPDEVVAALGLSPGQVACDLGAGPGYFAIRMARAVGPAGRVHALDVEPRMIEILGRRVREAGVANVVAHLAPSGDEAAPPERCDLILLVDTFHHLHDGPGALRRLAARLAPGGRIANVDFHEGELPVGPPPDHKVSRGAFLAAATAAGLEVVREETFLPYQYFVVLRPR
jgi:ubiquinone/menaquinone biosynthesis C-methylase UbiE